MWIDEDKGLLSLDRKRVVDLFSKCHTVVGEMVKWLNNSDRKLPGNSTKTVGRYP